MTTKSLYNTTGILARAFPPPHYLTMPAVGIDISDYAIKYVMFERKGDKVALRTHGKLDIPLDVIERGEIKDPQTIVKLLTRLKEEFGFTHAHLSLPEEHAYLFQMELPHGAVAERDQMLEFHLKENVPIGADEAVYDYNLLKTKGDNQVLNVSVYPMAIAFQYVGAVEESGIQALSVEIEGQATARALLDEDMKKPTLVIDIGRNDASLSISTQGTVTFTAGLETGGDDLTRAIARTLDVSFQKAEQLKRKHGFTDTNESQPVFNALLPAVSKVSEAIRKHLMYWQMHMRTASGAKENVARVVLAGGNANMRGLAEYIEATLEVPVEIGNVWHTVFADTDHVPSIPVAESLEYATAVGLALRSLMRSS